MVHAAVAHARPGDVLVLTLPQPEPVALVGDLLATQAQERGVAALLVDAAVRDAGRASRARPPGLGALDPGAGRREERRRRRSTSRSRSAARRSVRVTRSCSTRTVRSWSRRSVSPRCSRRPARAAQREHEKRALLAAGALSYDLDGLRERVEGGT